MNKLITKIVKKPLEAFLHNEAASGVLLGLCAILAMLIANSFAANIYFQILNLKIFNLSLQHWINDGLMTIFFFVIGMEIKKELLIGELSRLQKAALPVAAALGGMIVPALIYFLLNRTPPDLNGWGIPMATDIAFALGILTLFGPRVPLSLKVFLLALAIVDDLGAILVIAFFYTKQINFEGLVLAAILFLLMHLFKKKGVSSYYYYVLLGFGAWFGFLYSGVHATVAGVIIGLLTPLKFEYRKTTIKSCSPLQDLIHKLHPWVSFAIMPLFAFANAGIDLRGIDYYELLKNPIHQGVLLGLLFGKPIGIFIFSFVAVRLGVAIIPSGLRWSHLIGVSFLGGIGFTMSLFISGLALAPDQEIFSKTGIVTGSLLATVFGSVILYFAFKSDRSKGEPLIFGQFFENKNK